MREAKAAEAKAAAEATDEPTTVDEAAGDSGPVFLDELPETKRNAPPSRPSMWTDKLNALVDAPSSTNDKWAKLHETGTTRTANSVASAQRNKLRETPCGIKGLSDEGTCFQLTTRGKAIFGRYNPAGYDAATPTVRQSKADAEAAAAE